VLVVVVTSITTDKLHLNIYQNLILCRILSEGFWERSLGSGWSERQGIGKQMGWSGVGCGGVGSVSNSRKKTTNV